MQDSRINATERPRRQPTYPRTKIPRSAYPEHCFGAGVDDALAGLFHAIHPICGSHVSSLLIYFSRMMTTKYRSSFCCGKRWIFYLKRIIVFVRSKQGLVLSCCCHAQNVPRWVREEGTATSKGKSWRNHNNRSVVSRVPGFCRPFGEISEQ